MTATRQTIRTGIGAALRAERQRRKISLDVVSRGTLVRQDFLELIDEDRLEDLPSGAYAKGFIRAYAMYLGLDPKKYLTVYENRCGRPEPELSKVVRRGVRVPPAAQKRAWKIAIGSAAGIVLLLALLGAFKSGEEPAQAPGISATAARVTTTAAPNVMGALVRVEVIGDQSWVEASADGKQIFGQVMKHGQFTTFKGTDQIELFLARPKQVRITANGVILGTPTTPMYRGTFTPKTTAMPADEPAAPKASTSPPPANAAPASSAPGSPDAQGIANGQPQAPQAPQAP